MLWRGMADRRMLSCCGATQCSGQAGLVGPGGLCVTPWNPYCCWHLAHDMARQLRAFIVPVPALPHTRMQAPAHIQKPPELVHEAVVAAQLLQARVVLLEQAHKVRCALAQRRDVVMVGQRLQAGSEGGRAGASASAVAVIFTAQGVAFYAPFPGTA